MSMFELAIPIVLRHEGGFVNDPADPGGATNFGVSLRWLKAQGLLTELEHSENTDDPIVAVKRMTVEEASAFYKQYWWDAYHYQNLVAQAIANKVFDTAVNVGAPRAHRWLQAVVNANPRDGIIGPGTLVRLNGMNPLEVLTKYQALQAGFYRYLVQMNPARQKFLDGWLKRAYDQV